MRTEVAETSQCKCQGEEEEDASVYIGLLGAFLAAAPLDAAELNWLPLTGTERAPASSGEQVLQGPFTSWWFGDFASVAIWFFSNPAGLYFYVK